ncbi:type VI secretion system baseplate subunit TssF [Tamlana sp. 2_MG-2023]|uniref:type VI secretion system baseplate subunit TssF n=1 Tax=unclassified Tamlana TaxID=2614803 RepID=UPI0026E307DC|nr:MULTISPECIES: type VI secretion system baseplate subunit TssF [unclassified Tamlana]MDO6761534.1 type VI secretion system baseplate subunit TssF [Tamlana sp. 2_MG-2023]MDO6792372.1 type VI secretion system baseplate subunit TssF [Tamlana sp. 1_MG-2023]
MSYNTKEDIKNRMMKKAASLWDIPVNEVSDSFDPIISLLLSACASEIEKLSGDINDSQNRITERLIQLMTPLSTFDVKPAHAIAYCESVEPKSIITPEHQLYYKKKNTSANNTEGAKDVFFTPTQEMNLLDARLKYVITGDKLITFSNRKSKDLTSILKAKFDSNQTTLFLGIESDQKQINLNDISFYFEHLGVSNSELFYHHLHNASWYIGDKKIKTINGYHNSDTVNCAELDHIIDGVSSKSNLLSAEVNQYYQKHFVTLKLDNTIYDFPKYPELEELEVEGQEAFLVKNILWIKVQFSSIISSKSLEQLYCTINAFPVLNRKRNHFTYQMRNFIDIIPILSEDPFFDVQTIENTSGQIYKNDGANATDGYLGSYFLRSDNVGKLDSRKAQAYIVHLLELLKDESAAFTFFNHEFLQNNLNTLNQTIASIEKKLNEVVNDGVYTNYIYLNPFTSNENVKVVYWTTNGEEANHIKSGRSLEIYKGSHLKPKSSYLIRPVFGGSNSLSMEQRLQAYRRITLTKNRIVTEEDLKALCYELYTDNIKSIEIKKGFTTDLSVNKGVLQCIEIILTPSEHNSLKTYEWDYLNENLLAVLKKQSVNIFPYKIINKAS